jgi:hypothetical protein
MTDAKTLSDLVSHVTLLVENHKRDMPFRAPETHPEWNARLLNIIWDALRNAQTEAPQLAHQWCPICKRYHDDVGEKTDAGDITRPCPRIPTDDPRYYGSEFYTGRLGI